MIEKLILKNYRNLQIDDGIAFDPLTILVGPNGSGKTNVIRILRFLQDAWIGSEDDKRGVTRFERAVARLGSGGILDRRENVTPVVGIDARFKLQSGYRHGIELELDVHSGHSVSMRHEILQRWPEDRYPDYDGYRYYDVNLASRNSYISLFRDDVTPRRTSRRQPVDNLPANELAAHSLQQWVEQNVQTPTRDTPFFEGKRWIDEYLREWAFFDASQMSVDSIRRASPEIGAGDRILSSSGDNLALVLFNLSNDSIDFQERIRELMTEIFPGTRSLRANVVGRVSLTVEWYQKGIRDPFFLDEMSDGTVRMLCWATVLFAPKLPQLLVLDEPEASLHPAWMRVLAGWIRDAARRTQIVLSTHSPDLLDYFTDDIASVRAFGGDPEDPLRYRVRGADLQSAQEEISRGWQLGDLYRIGSPAIGGWPW